MPIEIATDRDLVQVQPRYTHERLGGELCVPDRVVLELEIGRDLHQLGPVGAGRVAHAGLSFVRAPMSLRGEPALWRDRRRTPQTGPRRPASDRGAGRS